MANNPGDLSRAIHAMTVAAKTTDQTSGPHRPIGKAVYVVVKCTARAPGLDVVPTIQIQNAAGDWVTVAAATVPVDAIATFAYLFGEAPAAISHGLTEVVNRHLPQAFRLLMDHTGAFIGSYTVQLIWAN